MSKVGEGLNWHVIDREGETRAVCRYAIDAAGLALERGIGTTVRHGHRIVLELTIRCERTVLERPRASWPMP
jgi:hypothetical protein